MKQIADNSSDICEFNEKYQNNDGRVFNYVLDNKRAKAKLLKGAMRGKHLVVESKPGCVNLIFIDGSYCQTLLPLLREWHQKQNQKIYINKTEVEIIEINSGIDKNKKHVDTKLILLAENSRLVLHAYNSTQKLMVQGQNYEKFALSCLEPFFQVKIDETIEEITKINDDIKESLNMKRDFKIKETFNCPQCEVVSSSKADLKVHMKFCHTKPCISSPPRTKVPKVLQEDLSISAIDEHEILEIEIEETLEDQVSHDCKWESCSYTAKSTNDLQKHFEDEHMEYLRSKYLSDSKQENDGHEQISKGVEDAINGEDEIFKETNIEVVTVLKCNACEFERRSCADMEEHQKNGFIHNGEEPQIPLRESVVICGTCAQGFETEIEFGKHAENHTTLEDFKCAICEVAFNSAYDLRRHTKFMHGNIKKAELTEDIFVEQRETCFKCEDCIFIGNESQVKKHWDIKHVNQFQCQVCGSNFPNINTLNHHMEMRHKIKPLDDNMIKCRRCTESFEDSKSFNKHICRKHESQAEPFPCEICGLVLATFSLLQEHMTSFHAKNRGSCRYCDHTARSEDDLKEHLIQEHENIVILHSTASQVDALTDKAESFESFKEEVMNMFAKLLGNHNEIKQELFLIRNNLANHKPEPASDVGKHLQRDKEPLKKSYKDVVESNIRAIRKESEVHVDNHETAPNTKPLEPGKVLWFGTSLSKPLDIQKFQKETKTTLRTVKAFGIKRQENQSYPEMTFNDIVLKVLKDEDPETIVLEGGNIEITNIDVKKALMDDEKDIEDYKKEWFEKTEEDSANLFNVAERAIEDNPNRKVIILKRLPRNDPLSIDPLGIKKQLSKFGNDAFDQLWFKRGGQKNNRQYK